MERLLVPGEPFPNYGCFGTVLLILTACMIPGSWIYDFYSTPLCEKSAGDIFHTLDVFRQNGFDLIQFTRFFEDGEAGVLILNSQAAVNP